jgi:hypothetical protein
MDIFFIDWEKPSTPVKGPNDIPDVSTWRSLFATNEWNELLSYRRCSLEFTLILIMWLFSGQNWIYVATSRPNQFDLSVGALSAPLQFFFVLLLFHASSVCQYLVRVFILERFIRFFNHWMLFVCTRPSASLNVHFASSTHANAVTPSASLFLCCPFQMCLYSSSSTNSTASMSTVAVSTTGLTATFLK